MRQDHAWPVSGYFFKKGSKFKRCLSLSFVHVRLCAGFLTDVWLCCFVVSVDLWVCDWVLAKGCGGVFKSCLAIC